MPSGIDDSFQPFLRYLPPGADDGRKRPLIVYLHGYAPDFNIVNWDELPGSLTNFVQEAGFCLAAPFARGNTDYHGVGEQDVLRVTDEMCRRYAIDENRILLAGISMGGMGVWTVGARHPDRFAGLVVVSGRGDYYFWHKLRREDVPSYKQELVDADFACSLLPNLARIPAFVIHGADDSLIPVEEARHMVERVRTVNPDLTYVEVEGGDHWIYEQAFARPDLHQWMRNRRRERVDPPAMETGPRAGLIRNAFLSPFVFVCASPADTNVVTRLRGAAADWYAYAHAMPRLASDRSVTTAELAAFNVFLFGEPESSAWIREALRDSPVRVEPDAFVVGARRFPRAGNGLYLARPNPWNPGRLAIVQCGAPWGKGTAPNHKYDFLPDFIVYTAEADEDGSNTALCAGFFGQDWHIASNRLYSTPVVPGTR